MSLAGLNVLVTRPAGQADGLITAIKEAGGCTYHCPVMVIKPLDQEYEPERVQACRQVIMALDTFQQVIFVSTNAVHFGLQWIQDYWPQLPVGIQWHAIGSSTARQLRAEGVEVDTNAIDSDVSAMNSESLLRHSALQQIAGEHILIVRGVHGREHLKKQLTQRGASVSYVECYHRTLPDEGADNLASLLTQSVNVICVNSGDSLDNLCHLGANVLPVLLSKRLIVPSQRVADLAARRGFKQLCVADNASDQAMCKALSTVAGAD